MAKKSFIPALRFNWLTQYYDTLVRLAFPEQELKSELVNQIHATENSKILDFGCGSGTLAIMIQKAYPHASVTGVDVDPEILFIAEKKVSESGLKIKLVKYDGINLPFDGKEVFDIVVSSLVFHHLSTNNKEVALKEIYNALKSGGKFFILDFGKPRSIYTKIAFAIFRRLDGEENTRVNAYGHLSTFVKNSGFITVEELKLRNTALGTVTLIQGTKPLTSLT